PATWYITKLPIQTKTRSTANANQMKLRMDSARQRERLHHRCEGGRHPRSKVNAVTPIRPAKVNVSGFSCLPRIAARPKQSFPRVSTGKPTGPFPWHKIDSATKCQSHPLLRPSTQSGVAIREHRGANLIARYRRTIRHAGASLGGPNLFSNCSKPLIPNIAKTKCRAWAQPSRIT